VLTKEAGIKWYSFVFTCNPPAKGGKKACNFYYHTFLNMKQQTSCMKSILSISLMPITDEPCELGIWNLKIDQLQTWTQSVLKQKVFFQKKKNRYVYGLHFVRKLSTYFEESTDNIPMYFGMLQITPSVMIDGSIVTIALPVIRLQKE
jgi:hypothetical protein